MAECPFSWTAQKEGCWIFARDVWKPVACRGASCELGTGGECVFNRISKTLESIQTELKYRQAK